MKKEEFKDSLMLYGADLSAWPRELSAKAEALLKAGGEVERELRALVEEESTLEALLGERSFEEPGDYLASRIISHAKESALEEGRGFLGALIGEFFTPRAALALALTLIIGFMTGYMTPEAIDPFDQLLEDETMLVETFSTLFMESDIFE